MVIIDNITITLFLILLPPYGYICLVSGSGWLHHGRQPRQLFFINPRKAGFSFESSAPLRQLREVTPSILDIPLKIT